MKKHRLIQNSTGLAEFGDKFIPWTVSKENKIYQRFYHFFTRKEVLTLFKDYKVLKINKWGGPTNRDNFFILAQKI